MNTRKKITTGSYLDKLRHSKIKGKKMPEIIISLDKKPIEKINIPKKDNLQKSKEVNGENEFIEIGVSSKGNAFENDNLTPRKKSVQQTESIVISVTDINNARTSKHIIPINRKDSLRKLNSKKSSKSSKNEEIDELFLISGNKKIKESPIKHSNVSDNSKNKSEKTKMENLTSAFHHLHKPKKKNGGNIFLDESVRSHSHRIITKTAIPAENFNDWKTKDTHNFKKKTNPTPKKRSGFNTDRGVRSNLMKKKKTNMKKINLVPSMKDNFPENLFPDSDNSENEDEIFEEIVGDDFVHPFKTIHYKFLEIVIKKEKDPIIYEIPETAPGKESGGYGNMLSVKKHFKNGGVLSSNAFSQKSNRSILSAKSGMTSKSFRATLNNRFNSFRSMSLGKIKQNYKFQILIGSSIAQIKSFFGCISSCLLPYYNTGLPNDYNFLRKEAKKLEYTDEILDNLSEKLKQTETFKKVTDYTPNENMKLDTRIREARTELDNFEVDVFLFEEFYGRKLPIKDFNSR